MVANQQIAPPHDLAKANLNGANLMEAQLRSVNLNKAHLEGANLHAAYLREADLHDANLKKAILNFAHLEWGNLFWARLGRANLTGARLKWADLTGVHLEGANLTGAHLEEANLTGAHLEGANFTAAHLEEANLTDAHLEGADLWSANLKGANLRKAVFRRAKLWGTGLEDADLREADLRNTNLRAARLDNADVMGVRYNRKTSFKAIRLGNSYGSPMFRRFAQDHEYLEELKTRSWWGKPLFWLWLIVADCGRTPWYWFAWSIFFVFLFALLFTPCPEGFVLYPKFWVACGAWVQAKWAWLASNLTWLIDLTGPVAFQHSGPVYSGQPVTFGSALYFSLVNFTTLGFGDVLPTTRAARFLVGVEVVLGYVMLGGLISIFANKLARRS